MNDIKTPNPCALDDNDFAPCASPNLNWASNLVGIIFLAPYLSCTTLLVSNS